MKKDTKILEMLQKQKYHKSGDTRYVWHKLWFCQTWPASAWRTRYAKRTHGGAILRETIGAQYNIGDLTAKERIAKVDPNYLAIAKKAVTCINDNDVIFITSASIGYLMTQNLPHDLNCTIVTNSISIADNLRQYPNITILLLGGQLHKNGCVYDGFAIEMLKRLRFDKIFITSARVSADFGLSIQRTRNLCLYNTLLASAKKFMDFTLPAKLAQILL